MAVDLIVIAGKDPTGAYGGSETYLRALGRAALRAGFVPHLFCVSDRSGKETTDFGIVHRAWTPVRPLRTLMIAFHQVPIVRQVVRFAQAGSGPCLIHSIGSWSGVGEAAARRLRRQGRDVTLLATPFTTYNHETRGKLLGLDHTSSLAVRLQFRLELLWTILTVDPSERAGLRGADLIIPNYKSVQAILENEFGPGLTFGRITYASEHAFLKESGPKPPRPAILDRLADADAPLIVAVSRHDPRKGLDVLLRALGDVRARGIPFRACLVGSGQLLEEHRRLAAELGLSQSTLLPGSVPDIDAVLNHADIFVLPSLEEGSGSVSLLEAMQAGLAPIVSRIDGLPEDVAEGESALLVPPGNPRALADALARCLTQPDLRHRLSAGALARYRERFSADSFTADLVRVYGSFGFSPSGLPPDPAA